MLTASEIDSSKLNTSKIIDDLCPTCKRKEECNGTNPEAYENGFGDIIDCPAYEKETENSRS